VILALFLISAGIAVVYGILTSIGSSGSNRDEATNYKDTYINSRTFYNKDADEAPTKMPLSQWKKAVATDIKGHCIQAGMTAAEVEKAVGKPTNAKTVTYGSGSTADKGNIWEYVAQEIVKEPCSRYEGEKCADPVKYKTTTATLYFSPNGHLTYPYLNGKLKTHVYCE
jgi:hypothetical protein